MSSTSPESNAAVDTEAHPFTKVAPAMEGAAEFASQYSGERGEAALYHEHYPTAKKTMWIRPVDPAHDTEIITKWMNLKHVVPYWKMDWPPEKIRKYLDDMQERPGFECFITYMDEEPFGYLEMYDPTRDRLAECYDAKNDDGGLHIMIGEEKYLKKFIIRLSITVLRFVFVHWPEAPRAVGEPDEQNKQVLGLMRFLGFRFLRKINFPEKVADLLTLTREDFQRGHGNRV